MPVKYRGVELTEDISGFKPWQVKWCPVKDEDTLTPRHTSQCLFHTKRVKREASTVSVPVLTEIATEVPTHFIGLQANDQMAMCLGGSGDYFAFASARKLHSIGGELWRLPAFKLKVHRGMLSKDDDALLLAKLLQSHLEDSYPTVIRDLSIIRVRETFKLRMDAMKDRMACAQRLRQRLIGMTFCTTEGGFPQGNLEKEFDDLKASDPIFTAIKKAETHAHKAMKEAVESTDVYQKLFVNILGLGPAISARVISCIIDIRRFETAPKLKKFLGVHVLPDGTFPRRRKGEVASWHPDGRQALYLLADQFVKKPGSEWGTKLNAYKAKFRQKHPYVCIEPKTSETQAELELRKCLNQGDNSPQDIARMEKELFTLRRARIEASLVPLVPSKYKIKEEWYQILDDDGTVIRQIRGPKRYNNGHIHQMAIWRTLSKFAEWLHREWWKIEDTQKTVSFPGNKPEGSENQKIA